MKYARCTENEKKNTKGCCLQNYLKLPKYKNKTATRESLIMKLTSFSFQHRFNVHIFTYRF